jgi:hypothetical protein
MEYIYSQTPAKSQPTPKSRKFDPYANIIDLSADSPVRMKKNNNNNKGLSLLGEDDDEDDYPILSGPRSNINTITNNNSTPSSSSSAFRNNSNAGNTQPSRPNPRSDKFQRFTSASQLVDMEADQSSFGASIAKSKPKTSSTPSSSRSYSSYIRPATGFARQNGVANTTHMAPLAGYTADGWPKWVDEGSSEAAAPKARDPGAPAPRDDEEEGEEFDIANVQYTAKDFETCSGDPEEQMRELLAEAVGDGEEGHTEGDEIIDGFAAHLRLMPHQVRGVRWMRERESGRRNGGILADVGPSLRPFS